MILSLSPSFIGGESEGFIRTPSIFPFIHVSIMHKLPKQTLKRLVAIERHLHKWAEDECNGVIQWSENGEIPYGYKQDAYGIYSVTSKLVDRKSKWLAEADKLAAECGGKIYHQGDPRGCALYFYRESDLDKSSLPIGQIYNTHATALCE